MKPFIKNKVEKTIVDYFLLEDDELLQKKYNSSEKIVNDLNTFEIILLL